MKSIKDHWKRAVSGLLAMVMAAGMLPASALTIDPGGIVATGTTSTYAPTGDFELNVAGATAWNGGEQALVVYKAESGSAINATIRDAVPFALLEDNGGNRIKIGYVEDGPWTGSTMDSTGWADKDDILVNLPDVIPSIAYDRDTAKQFNSRLTRHEYVIPGTYALAEQLAQLQKSAMSGGDTLVVRQSGQTVSVSRAKGDSDQLHSYSLDGAVYQKYDAWTEYEDQEDSLSDLSYEPPYSINRAYSADPSITLTAFCPQTVSHTPAVVSASDPTGGVGAYNPGSPGGSTPEHEIWYMPMLCTDIWQGRILWQHLSTLLTAKTKSAEVRPADTTALPTPPIKTPVDSEMPAPLPVIVPEYAATSTGQLTLF